MSWRFGIQSCQHFTNHMLLVICSFLIYSNIFRVNNKLNKPLVWFVKVVPMEVYKYVYSLFFGLEEMI